MSSSHYVQVPYPWKASVDVREEGPSRFYAHLVSQALRYGLPTRRRFGALLGAVGRAGIPAGPVAAALRALPRRERPDVDALLDEVGASWGELAARSERLPRAVGALSALALQRKIGLTVFVFAGGDAPLVVCKVPEPGDDRVEAEARALDEAAPAGVAPRHLGRVGAAVVQEALDGHALRVEPVDPDSAAAARWSDEHQQLADGLERLAEVTHKQQPVGELAGPLERALAEHSLGSSARRALEGAAADVARVVAPAELATARGLLRDRKGAAADRQIRIAE